MSQDQPNTELSPEAEEFSSTVFNDIIQSLDLQRIPLSEIYSMPLGSDNIMYDEDDDDEDDNDEMADVDPASSNPPYPIHQSSDGTQQDRRNALQRAASGLTGSIPIRGTAITAMASNWARELVQQNTIYQSINRSEIHEAEPIQDPGQAVSVAIPSPPEDDPALPEDEDNLDQCPICMRWDVPGLVRIHDPKLPNAPGNNILCKHLICAKCYFKIPVRHVDATANINLCMKLCPYCSRRPYPVTMPWESTKARLDAWKKKHATDPNGVTYKYNNTSTEDASSRMIKVGMEVNPGYMTKEFDDIYVGCNPRDNDDDPDCIPVILEPAEQRRHMIAVLKIFGHIVEPVIKPEYSTEFVFRLWLKQAFYHLIQYNHKLKERLETWLTTGTNAEHPVTKFILSGPSRDPTMIQQDYAIQKHIKENNINKFVYVISTSMRVAKIRKDLQTHTIKPTLIATEAGTLVQYRRGLYPVIYPSNDCTDTIRNQAIAFPFPLESPGIVGYILGNLYENQDILANLRSIKPYQAFDTDQTIRSVMKEQYQRYTNGKTLADPSSPDTSISPRLMYFLFWSYDCLQHRTEWKTWLIPFLNMMNTLTFAEPEYLWLAFHIYAQIFSSRDHYNLVSKLVIRGNPAQLSAFLCYLDDWSLFSVFEYIDRLGSNEPGVIQMMRSTQAEDMEFFNAVIKAEDIPPKAMIERAVLTALQKASADSLTRPRSFDDPDQPIYLN